MKGLVTGQKIYRSIKTGGFNSFFVTGNRGIGKSSYSLIVAYEVFRHLGFSRDEAWAKSLDSLKFKIEDIIDFLLLYADADQPAAVLIWDDCATFASGSKYFLNMKLVDSLKGCMDMIRTSLNSLLMTCPQTKGVLSLLLAYDDFQIEIKHCELGGSNRKAMCYRWKTLPSGKRIVYSVYYDNFSNRLPNPIYQKYSGIRKQALKDTLQNFKESLS